MSVGGLPPTHRTVLTLRSRGTSTTFFRRPCTAPDGNGQLMGWIASLKLEDEVRQDLDLPRVVYEYVEVFLDELSGLPL